MATEAQRHRGRKEILETCGLKKERTLESAETHLSARSVPLWLTRSCCSRCKELLRNRYGRHSRHSQIVRGAPQPDSGFDARVRLRLPQDGPRFPGHADVGRRRIVRG